MPKALNLEKKENRKGTNPMRNGIRFCSLLTTLLVYFVCVCVCANLLYAFTFSFEIGYPTNWKLTTQRMINAIKRRYFNLGRLVGKREMGSSQRKIEG